MKEEFEMLPLKDIPTLIDAKPLPPLNLARFSALLTFSNGEKRVFVLPADEVDAVTDDVICHDGHVFSQGIWESMYLTTKDPRTLRTYGRKTYADGIQLLAFKNQFVIPTVRCYKDSVPYTVPNIVNESVYEDAEHRVSKLWVWRVANISERDDFHKLIIRNFNNRTTFSHNTLMLMDYHGKELVYPRFEYVSNCYDKLMSVYFPNEGYGCMNTDGKIVIRPMHYDKEFDFIDGFAIIERDGSRFVIDTQGREYNLFNPSQSQHYVEVEHICGDRFLASVKDIAGHGLAYHSDTEFAAGIWGIIDLNGNEIVKPQYIFAYTLNDTLCAVAKGEWTIDKKWDNKYTQGKYGSEEELWGIIDSSGKEILPCKYDEIKRFHDYDKAFQVHVGGWEDGNWGVVDENGNWIVEPIFKGLSGQYSNGLIVFYYDAMSACYYENMGVYDIGKQRVIVNADYSEIELLDNGDIYAERIGEDMETPIRKIFDSNGIEHFPLEYFDISFCSKQYYRVIKEDEKEELKYGFIDNNGNVVVPCSYTVFDSDISADKKLCVFGNCGRRGMMDFNQKIIVPPQYDNIRFFGDFLLVEKNKLYGLFSENGNLVLPIKYQEIKMCNDKKHILAKISDAYEMFCVDKKVIND